MIKNIMIGNVTSNSVTIAGKVPYIIPGPDVSGLKVYTMTYDKFVVKTYINNKLIATASNVGVAKDLNDIFIGADYNDTAWFKGVMPAVAFYDNSLPDTERIAMTKWYADSWLPTGTTFSDGYTVAATASTKPTWISTLGEAFLDFDDTGLIYSPTQSTRIIGCTDSSINGTQRVATSKTGTTLGITTVKSKPAMTYDNQTYLKIPAFDIGPNAPDSMTIFFVASFVNFDNTSYSGQDSQTLLGAGSNNAFRFKKYNVDSYLSLKWQTSNSGNSYLVLPRTDIVTTPTYINTNVKLRLSTSATFSTYVESSTQVANGFTNYGTTKHSFSGLSPYTKYYGKFIVNSIPETGNDLSFRTYTTDNSFKIVTGSCNQTGSSASTWSQMLSEDADLFVHMGDLHYENINSSNPQDYSNVYDLALGSSEMSNFFKNQNTVYLYDNHDSLASNPNNTFANWATYLPFYDKIIPHLPFGSSDILSDGTYFSWVMGRNRLIMTGMRSKRDPITNIDSPSKTTLGATQKAWLKAELLAAKAANQNIIWFTCICYIADVDNPFGLSFKSGGASWGSYAYERKEIANFIYDNQIKNVSIVSGDTHMQAMDDGRNSVYATDGSGNKRDWKTLSKDYIIPCLGASPFDRYIEPEGGPYQINDFENSGLVEPSRELSYGVITIEDIGENWLQMKYTLKGFLNDEWVILREYTYNRTMVGLEGIPPSTTPDILNQNGYVGQSSQWKGIYKRYVGQYGEWKPQRYKFMGVNGYWVMVYNDDVIPTDKPFKINSLQGYTVNENNYLEIYGERILDSQFPQPKVGSYFELSKNYSDLYENLTTGFVIGTGVTFSIVDDIKCITYNSINSYFELPYDPDTGFNSNAFVGTDGFNDMAFSVWVNVNALPIGPNKNYVWSYGSTASNGGIYIDSSGKVNVEFREASTQTFTTTESVIIGWNKIFFNRKALDNIYTFLWLNNVKCNLSFDGLVVPPQVTPYPILIGAGIVGSGLVVSSTGYSFANVYLRHKGYLSDNHINILSTKPVPTVVLKGATEYVIPTQWMGGISNDKIAFTVPPNGELPIGEYRLVIRSDYYESTEFPLRVEPVENMTDTFDDNFSNVNTLSNNYYVLNRSWGGANGGVVPENVFIRDGELILRANGDNYTGDVQGVDRYGIKKLHTHASDPQLGLPWKNRVGGCIVYNKKTGFGSYELDVMIPNNLGCAYAMWTFFYNELYPSSPNYQSLLDEGLHQQGNSSDGYYITRNHEIDIEFPSHLEGGNRYEPSLSNMKCNTWRGENQNWDVAETDPSYWEEYHSTLTPVGSNIADGNYHKLRFDWYPDKVEFFIDGVLKTTNVNTSKGDTIPDITGYFTFGAWFPSSALTAKPWLVNPLKGWAGGITDVDGGQKANFDSVEMRVRNFKFIPFNEYSDQLRVLGETYPFGGYNKK